MKIWIDTTRPAPEGYIWVRTVIDAKYMIETYGNYRRFFNYCKRPN